MPRKVSTVSQALILAHVPSHPVPFSLLVLKPAYTTREVGWLDCRPRRSYPDHLRYRTYCMRYSGAACPTIVSLWRTTRRKQYT